MQNKKIKIAVRMPDKTRRLYTVDDVGMRSSSTKPSGGTMTRAGIRAGLRRAVRPHLDPRRT